MRLGGDEMFARQLFILQYYFHFYNSFSSYSYLHQQFSITKLEWVGGVSNMFMMTSTLLRTVFIV